MSVDVDHFDVELEEDPSGIDHFDVDLPDQTVTVLTPPVPPITVHTGEDVVIQMFEFGIPGIPGPPGQGFNIVGESPTGALDGVNRNFTTLLNFMANTLAVFLNGLRQEEFLDYIVLASNEFQMNDSPLAGDRLKVDYIVG